MSLSDPIGDMLSRIRNAQKSKKTFCFVPHSKLRHSVLETLLREGFIRAVNKEEDNQGKSVLRIDLKYCDGDAVIKQLNRVSRPGRRVYSKIADLSRVYAGLGISIISTPRGVLTDSEARTANVGGEVLCTVF